VSNLAFSLTTTSGDRFSVAFFAEEVAYENKFSTATSKAKGGHNRPDVVDTK
jgi:hypothetical protein